MKIKNLIIQFMLFTMIYFTGNSQDYHVRIAFIGNSITVTNAPLNDYPSQFADMLSEIYGDTAIVSNYAVSGRTMLKKGDYPIWNEPNFTYCLQSAPDILFILLGTNDSKPYNWDVYGDEFFADYMSMIDTFMVRNPGTKFIVALPPPAFAVNYDIRPPVIANDIIPLIDSVANETGAYLVDFYTPLLDSVSLFPDNIHPNVEGSMVMAQIVLDKFFETDIMHQVELGYTYVTHLESDKAHVLENDSVTLSWTSANADTVYLNGQGVPANGSLKVSSDVPTAYTVKAMGVKNNDSLTLMQDFYHPVISKLTMAPGKPMISVGDTIHFTITYRDQYSKPMQNDSTAITWSVTEGNGTLTNEDFTSAMYIAENVGVDTVIAQIHGVFDESYITIGPGVSLRNHSNQQATLFPNPANGMLHITGIDFNKLELIDINGKVVFSGNSGLRSINTGRFENGIYFLKLYTPEQIIVQKIEIRHK